MLKFGPPSIARYRFHPASAKEARFWTSYWDAVEAEILALIRELSAAVVKSDTKRIEAFKAADSDYTRKRRQALFLDVLRMSYSAISDGSRPDRIRGRATAYRAGIQVLAYYWLSGELPNRLGDIEDAFDDEFGRPMELLPTPYGFLIYSRGEKGDSDGSNWDSVRAMFRLRHPLTVLPGSRS